MSMTPSAGAFAALLVLAVIHSIAAQRWSQPTDASGPSSPFFFFCRPADNGMKDAHKIKVEISGNPTAYVPSTVYKISIWADEEFDSFLVTGVYSISDTAVSPFAVKKSDNKRNPRKMCAVLSSSDEQHPTQKAAFMWMAPPQEMGCVDFVATFTKQDAIVLKDTRIYRICPESEQMGVGDLKLTGKYQDGVLFRDDFESGDFDSSLWSEPKGVSVSQSCEPILYGHSASFCQKKIGEPMTLTTVALNLTSAGVLQFGFGRSSCPAGAEASGTKNVAANVTVRYGKKDAASIDETVCSGWTFMQNISLPKGREALVHVIPLPAIVRQPDVCIQWSVPPTEYLCMGVDDVIITSTYKRPSSLHIHFDPFQAADWIFFPGGTVTNLCRGEGHSLVFNASYRRSNWATSRDLHLTVEPSSDEFLWKADFDRLLPADRWEFPSASLTDENSCVSERILVIHASDVVSACTPAVDLTSGGNIRFLMKPWNPLCDGIDPGTITVSGPGKLNVWIDNDKRYNILSGITLRNETMLVSLTVPTEAQKPGSRICWHLWTDTFQENTTKQSWTVENVIVLPIVPTVIENVLQFRLQMNCDSSQTLPSNGTDDTPFNILVQYSRDQGRQWNMLHALCLPPTCSSAHSAIQSSWSSDEVRPWERITLPLPYAALSEPVRIRFIQKGRANQETRHWAIDDIHLSVCLHGCHGHGTCVENYRCVCDEGYEGEYCESTVTELAGSISEDFENIKSIRRQFLKYVGVVFGMSCGIVSMGNAATFSGPGSRQLLTTDFNTAEADILKFALRMGGPASYYHNCPGPDRTIESIYVHSSCNGGMTWSLVSVIPPSSRHRTQLITLPLSASAKGSSCRFKIWQPYHSGAGKDLWSIDDFYVGLNRVHSLVFNSSAPDSTAFVGQLVFGNYCNRQDVLLMQPSTTLTKKGSQDDDEMSLMLETFPLRIDSFSMIQLEATVGCGATDSVDANHSITVQFSTDGGATWSFLLNYDNHTDWVEYDPELKSWKRISLKLPPESWSPSTRFRIVLSGHPSLSMLGVDGRDSLAINYFYAGPECPELCRGHGRCSLDGCTCDEGFQDSNCLPATPLFPWTKTNETILVKGGRQAGSASLLTDTDSCFVHGAANWHFDASGIRMLETKDVEYSPGASVHFMLRLGYCDEQVAANTMNVTRVQLQLQVSWNGGSDWNILREYQTPFYATPQLSTVDIPPPEAFASNKDSVSLFKIRLVQIGLQNRFKNVWSVAGFGISSSSMTFNQLALDNVETSLEEHADFWIVRNVPDPKESCAADDIHCRSKLEWYGAVTKEVFLQKGDVIQFELAAKSSSLPSSKLQDHLSLDYSIDGGSSWQLVQEPCRKSWLNCRQMKRPSVVNYRTLRSGSTERFAYLASDNMANRTILLRWLHHNDGRNDQQTSGFQIKNLYIGRPCAGLCSGHGTCSKESCDCDSGYSGDDCSTAQVDNIAGFVDTFSAENRFDAINEIQSRHWDQLVGGRIVTDVCTSGHHRSNRVVFFEDRGPRMIRTVEINTQRIRMVQFTVGLTNTKIYKTTCHVNGNIKSNQLTTSLTSGSSILIDYSNNNGLTWTLLDSVVFDSPTERVIQMILPVYARTPATVLRWWQVDADDDSVARRLDWFLDDVVFNFNETNAGTFEYEVADEPVNDDLQQRAAIPSPIMADSISSWLSLQGLLDDTSGQSSASLLQFSGSTKASAETWDMEVTAATLAQFELIFPEQSPATFSRVRFEFSTDAGHQWQLVHDDTCFTQRMDEDDCEYLHFTSQYHLDRKNNVTRVTTSLPRKALSPATRFRWILEKSEPVDYNNNYPTWALGHVYIGGSSAWMCSGRGLYHNGVCKCDPGFEGPDCVPEEPLEQNFLENFESSAVPGSKRPILLSGGGISNMCGVLASGEAAVFHQNGLRYLETADLDMVSATYLQLSVKFNCWRENATSSLESRRVLLVYSVNAGISWHLLRVIKFDSSRNPQHLTINLMNRVELTNSTRLRLWQPLHAGEGNDTWAVDALFLHSTMPSTDLFWNSQFKADLPPDDHWTAWFGGRVHQFCDRDDVLVFKGQRGENGAVTKDMSITAETIVQFDINVGCDSSLRSNFTVRLEYSVDGGAHWNLLVANVDPKENPYETNIRLTPSIYYPSTSGQWRRVVIPLTHLGNCRSVRFRWYHGYLGLDDSLNVPHWAIGNVYIGPQCTSHCHGHGTCTEGGTICMCDPGFHGDHCEQWADAGAYSGAHHEIFSDRPDASLWQLTSGGEMSDSPFGSGQSLAFSHDGIRRLETKDWNLVDAGFVEFYVDFVQTKGKGAHFLNASQSDDPRDILLEYSTNGGIEWTLLQILGRRSRRQTSPKMYHVALPSRAPPSGTRLRWSQPGEVTDGQNDAWLIDEIFVGGESYALEHLEEDFTDSASLKDRWLLITGGRAEPSCNSNTTLHFKHTGSKIQKMATTRDIRIAEDTHLHYEISVGCNHQISCSTIRLEYSLDYGQTWQRIPAPCRVPEDAAKCAAHSLSSEFLSDATGFRRSVILSLAFLKEKIARFRWSDGHDPKYDWSLHWVHIGAQCGGCGGRGRCVKGSCVCLPDWTGERCGRNVKPLANSIRETFNVGHPSNVWARIQGGTVSSVCGTVASGASLHFHEGCHRYAETVELDLRQVDVIQFHLRAGCGQTTSRKGQILFQYSLNGGLMWTTALTLFLDDFYSAKLVSYVVAEQAKSSPGVKLRLWQSTSNGRMIQDWAIDSLITDGPLRPVTKDARPLEANVNHPAAVKTIKSSTPVELDQQKDQAAGRSASGDMQTAYGDRLWWRKVNVSPLKSLCKQEGHILQGSSSMEEESALETVDIILQDLKAESQLRFDLLVGNCDEKEIQASSSRFPVRFEVSLDHGVTWRLFQPLAMRGEAAGAPHVPSVYFASKRWQTIVFPLDRLSGVRLARFRWAQRRAAPIKWALRHFHIGVGSSSAAEQTFGRADLMEDFNEPVLDDSKWMAMTGGKLVVPSTKLAGGRAALFQGDGLRLLKTTPLDLRSAEAVQFTIHFIRDGQGDSFQRRLASVVYLQCSIDRGTTWTILQEYLPDQYLIRPDLAHATIPSKCRTPHGLLRWWQAYDPHRDSDEEANVALSWAIDNVLLDRSDHQLTEIYDPLRLKAGNRTLWQFYPEEGTSSQMCAEDDSHSLTLLTSKDGRQGALTSQRISLRDNYAAYFKIKTACSGDKSASCHGARGHIRFEMRRGFGLPSWSLVQASCLPDDEANAPLCLPNVFHEPSVYSAGSLTEWERIAVPLRAVSMATSWQFRWISDDQVNGGRWSVRDVYIGPMCPSHCSGHGDCVSGECRCDDGYKGFSCQPAGKLVPTKFPLLDNFDNARPPSLWQRVDGASIRVGCGSLIPHSHGRHLHFDGCSSRSAATVPIDVAKISHMAFVLRTGTPQQLPTCRIQPVYGNTTSSAPDAARNRAILLQYSFDGVQWLILASHAPRDFIQPRRLMYNIPSQFRHPTIQFRWWQPRHGGSTWDQWALDNVEFLP